MDVLAHVRAARRHDASERAWSLSSLWSVVDFKGHSRRKLQTIVREMLAGLDDATEEASPYDMATDADRVLMIGAAIAEHGPRWLAAHPRQAEWLSGRGIEPGEAVRRRREWAAEQAAFSGWEPLRGR